MSAAIKFQAIDTLGSTKVYSFRVNGLLVGVVTKSIDHRLNARDVRVAVATWSFATPVGNCDGYRTRDEAVAAAIDMLNDSMIEVVSSDRTPKMVDVHSFKATTGGFPRGANVWAFSIVGELGCMVKMASDAMTITKAEKEIVEFVKNNVSALTHDFGSIKAIRLCA